MTEIAFCLIVSLILEMRVAIARSGRRLDRVETFMSSNYEFKPTTDRIQGHA